MKHGVIIVFGAAILAAATAQAKPLETDWWRSNGAAVKEYTDAQEGAVCSLFLYRPNATLAVTWTRSNAEKISFHENDWWFQPDQQLAVAMEIGDSWLDGSLGGNPPHLMADTQRDHLSVTIEQPIESLLEKATSVTVRLADRETSVDVDTHTMRKLLRAVKRCRAVLKLGPG
jgi:hypothetical protein